MAQDFPCALNPKETKLSNGNLFKVNKDSESSDVKKSETFHLFEMKGAFANRGHPDIEPDIEFLSTRTQEPTEQDFAKLIKSLFFMVAARNDVLSLEDDNTMTLNWHIDTAFVVHHNIRSHKGSIFAMDKGSILSSSTIQKCDAHSSTESEINGVDNRLLKIIRVKRFMEYQDHKIKHDVIHEDNTGTIKLI